MSFHQIYSWFKLTQVDQVQAGYPFPIQYESNKPLAAGTKIQFFYTNDPNNPVQHVIKVYQSQATRPTGKNYIFLPNIIMPGVASNNNDPMVKWDTTSVTPGQYYICSQSNNGVNPVAIDCSDAPLNVVP